ncbi:MAG: MATE family efflux transporter [bacterium]|nr:MATE family efflux transporter [bacterium]
MGNTQETSYVKEYMKYACLNVLGMMGLSCYILADTFFVSKGLGANGLAALNLAIPVYSFIHGCGLMLGMGGATKYAIYRSQGRSRNADSMYSNTLFVSAVFAGIFLLGGAFLSEHITAWLGADDEIFAMTNIYLRVIMLYAPAFIMNDVLNCFVRNDGNPKLSMFAMLGSSMTNIVLDYVLIFPLHMGIFGAVFATGLSSTTGILILSGHWWSRKNKVHFVKTKMQWRRMFFSVSLGFPSLVTEVSSGIVMIVFNMILLNLEGNIGVAAYGVIANLSLVITAIYTGIAQGVQPLLSRTYGTNDKKNMRRLLCCAMATMFVLSCVVYGLVFLFADPITQIFNSEQNRRLQEIAVSGLKLYFTGIVFVGCNIILSVFFTSTEKAFPAHIVSLMRGLILIVPMAFLLSSLWKMTGVWLALPVTEGIVAVLGVILYRKFGRRTCA